MLVPDPAVLREALDHYRALVGDSHECDDPAIRRKIRDAAYTLCVLTGTRTPDTALSRAEALRDGPDPLVLPQRAPGHAPTAERSESRDTVPRLTAAGPQTLTAGAGRSRR